MHEGGFDPPKRDALDLKSSPFDQTRASMLDCDDGILFPTEVLTATTHSPCWVRTSDLSVNSRALCQLS